MSLSNNESLSTTLWSFKFGPAVVYDLVLLFYPAGSLLNGKAEGGVRKIQVMELGVLHYGSLGIDTRYRSDHRFSLV